MLKILQKLNISRKTVNSIKNGKYHKNLFDDDFKFPIKRKTNK